MESEGGTLRLTSKGGALRVTTLPADYPPTPLPPFTGSSSDPAILPILDLFSKGRNVLLHGPGGCGKSFAVVKLAEYIASQFGPDSIGVTATTGIAAVGVNSPLVASRTFHSWSGVGLGTDPPKKLVVKVMGNPEAMQRITRAKVLVIDEISMMGQSLFEKVEYVIRVARGDPRPFGGLLLLLTGDFLQLPPVKDEWVFEGQLWPILRLETISLSEPKRYSSEWWFNILMRIRQGIQTRWDEQYLEHRVEAYSAWCRRPPAELEVEPTILYSHKADVMAENMIRLAELDGPQYTFYAVDTFSKKRKCSKVPYEQQFNDAIPQAICLKVGAQVMLKTNMDVGRGLVNGTRGVVMMFITDDGALFDHQGGGGQTPVGVVIKTRAGNMVPVGIAKWERKDDNMTAVRKQIPLILAFSLTVHSCQGCTLDYAIVNLGPSIFAPGQAYVALSRVRGIDGLLLQDFLPSVIKTDPKAMEFVKIIEGELEYEYGIVYDE